MFDRDLGVDYVDCWTTKVQTREIGNKGDSSEGHVVRVVHLTTLMNRVRPHGARSMATRLSGE